MTQEKVIIINGGVEKDTIALTNHPTKQRMTNGFNPLEMLNDRKNGEILKFREALRWKVRRSWRSTSRDHIL